MVMEKSRRVYSWYWTCSDQISKENNDLWRNLEKNTTPLIALEGSIDSTRYMDECIDGSGIIIGMNEAYGAYQ